MKKYLILILIVIAIFVFMEKQDKGNGQEPYENEREYEVYTDGQVSAIEKIRETANDDEEYVEIGQLKNVLSYEVGDDVRDIIMSYLTTYNESEIVEEVIIDSCYDESCGYEW